MKLSTEALAGSSARHPWRVIGIWLVVLVAAGAFAAANLSGLLTSELKVSSDPESMQGLDRIATAGLNGDAANTETIVMWADNGTTIDDPAFQQRLQTLTGDVRTMLGEAPEASANSTFLNYLELKASGHPEADLLLSADRTKTVISVPMPEEVLDRIDLKELIDMVEAHGGDGYHATILGMLSINEAFNSYAEHDLIKAESIGIPIALVILVVVFGALVAPTLPIVLAIFAIGIAMGVVALVGQWWDLQTFIQNMVTMLGLAVGIDYALFIVERYREERAKGYAQIRAIERAGATSGKAVFFSGCTVVLALFGVFLVPTNIFRSLGLGAVIVVVLAVLATMTLLPAMLGLLGDRINWPRKRAALGFDGDHATEQDAYSGFWGRITHVVMARPIVSAVICLVLLLAAAAPLLNIKLGITGGGTMPPGVMKEAYGILTTDFSAGLISPVEIVIGGPRSETEPAIQQLVDRLNASGNFEPIAAEPIWSEDGQTAVLPATLVMASDSDRAYDVVRDLRATILPETIGQVPDAQTWVTGQTATNLDFLNVLNQYLPWVFAFVLSLSFVLLTLAFRSIVVPAKAIVMNLLSVGAAYGLMVLVFQEGVLAGFFGFQHVTVIESWIPILLFCVLFGLSMDYHVFLLSRIREHFDLTHRNRESVAVGLRSTAKIITGAAMIMVVVFASFASGRLVVLQQLGFGLAVSILIDATIIRSVLVPSSMALLGDWNWYLPRWLSWLPDLRIEGEPHEHAPSTESAPQVGPAMAND